MRSIYITSDNQRRLEELMMARASNRDRDHEAFQDLKSELNRAQVVLPQEVPPDVVTMHSQARVLDLDTREEMVFRLEFPEEANIDAGRLSVLAPLGTAMLGYRAGDTFEWRVPAGVRRLKILEVLYQPEASGQYATRAAAS